MKDETFVKPNLLNLLNNAFIIGVFRILRFLKDFKKEQNISKFGFVNFSVSKNIRQGHIVI